ncbi:hypothetical protein [Sphingomonas montanisoli]|uniref:DUF2946 domain-containing protein n=1 Tax=Sphingomonas montanisoli TaxID=2606412 RepID=A0A5D9CBC0_9SPHN|nr:hypothetical protein [Sphingomonas montanisoli]TZG29034.1 hypothetical protein FYJ91_02530 [Sphingomonas montanisoli]
MHAIRAFFRRHALLATIIVALALGVKALVPTGYMTSASTTGFTVTLCGGEQGQTVHIALPADPKRQGDSAKAESPCAFTGLGLATLGFTDPFLIAIAIAFIMAAGLRLTIAARPQQARAILPPTRGPPSIA